MIEVGESAEFGHLNTLRRNAARRQAIDLIDNHEHAPTIPVAGERRPTPGPLLIDGQFLDGSLETMRGVGRYGLELIAALSKLGQPILIVQPHAYTIDKSIRDFLDRLGIGIVRAPRQARHDNRRLHAWLDSLEGCALLLVNALPHPGWEHEWWPCALKTPLVPIVHDLIPLLFPQEYLDPWPHQVKANARMIRIIRDAPLVFCNSQSTRRDVQDICPPASGRIETIGFATPEFARNPGTDLIARASGIRLLCVGGNDARKQLFLGAKAAAIVAKRTGEKVQLVVVGPRAMPFDDLQRQAAPASLEVRAAISDSDLVDEYLQAHLLLFPSAYEGIGLPILEALALGLPVAAFATSSIPEVAQTNAWLADTNTAEALATAAMCAIRESTLESTRGGSLYARAQGWNGVAVRAARLLETIQPRVEVCTAIPLRPARNRLARSYRRLRSSSCARKLLNAPLVGRPLRRLLS